MKNPQSVLRGCVAYRASANEMYENVGDHISANVRTDSLCVRGARLIRLTNP